MDGGSPVMTESERRAYRYGQAAAPRLQQGLGLGCGGMMMTRKSWSNDSLSSYVGAGGGRSGASHACVCAPTTHPGSFRCKHHRQNASSNLGAAASHAHHEVHDETPASADQEKAS